MSATSVAPPVALPKKARLHVVHPIRPKPVYPTLKHARYEIEKLRHYKWTLKAYLAEVARVGRGRLQISFLNSVYAETLGAFSGAPEQSGKKPPRYSPDHRKVWDDKGPRPKLPRDYAAEVEIPGSGTPDHEIGRATPGLEGQMRNEIADAIERGLVTTLKADLEAAGKKSTDPYDRYRYRLLLNDWAAMDPVKSELQDPEDKEDSKPDKDPAEDASRAAIPARVRVIIPEKPVEWKPGYKSPQRVAELEFRNGARRGISAQISALHQPVGMTLVEPESEDQDILVVITGRQSLEFSGKALESKQKANGKPPERARDPNGTTVAVAARVDLRRYPASVSFIRKKFPTTTDGLLTEGIQRCQMEATARGLPVEGITDRLLLQALGQRGVTFQGQRRAEPYFRVKPTAENPRGLGTLVSVVANWMEQLASKGTVDEPDGEEIDPKRKQQLEMMAFLRGGNGAQR